MIIDNFRGKYAFLSNFYKAPITIKTPLFNGDDKEWPTAEHLYQACKVANPSDALIIKMQSTPGKAKKIAQKIEIIKDWDKLKLSFMKRIVQLKFEQNPSLLKKLLKTGDAIIIEGNTWGDKFWGKCNGEGKNHLGKILMELRDSYK
jgi:ribA/ribD-fused uncharacterized protein